MVPQNRNEVLPSRIGGGELASPQPLRAKARELKRSRRGKGTEGSRGGGSGGTPGSPTLMEGARGGNVCFPHANYPSGASARTASRARTASGRRAGASPSPTRRGG